MPVFVNVVIDARKSDVIHVKNL